MYTSLLSTFQICASPFISANKDNGPEALVEEIRYQLGRSFHELMVYYNIGKDIAVTIKMPAPGAPENLIVINQVEAPHSSRKNITFFLEDLQTYARDAHVRITYGGGREIAQIFYDPKDMYYTLMDLRADNFPEEIWAIPHLNMVKHVMERVENYVPALSLH